MAEVNSEGMASALCTVTLKRNFWAWSPCADDGFVTMQNQYVWYMDLIAWVCRIMALNMAKTGLGLNDTGGHRCVGRQMSTPPSSVTRIVLFRCNIHTCCILFQAEEATPKVRRVNRRPSHVAISFDGELYK